MFQQLKSIGINRQINKTTFYCFSVVFLERLAIRERNGASQFLFFVSLARIIFFSSNSLASSSLRLDYRSVVYDNDTCDALTIHIHAHLNYSICAWRDIRPIFNVTTRAWQNTTHNYFCHSIFVERWIVCDLREFFFVFIIRHFVCFKFSNETHNDYLTIHDCVMLVRPVCCFYYFVSFWYARLRN